MNMIDYDKLISLIKETSHSIRISNRDLIRRLEPQFQEFKSSVNHTIANSAAGGWVVKWVANDNYTSPPIDCQPDAKVIKHRNRLSPLLGEEICCSEWITINQDQIDAFALVTNDDQWIHVDIERSKKESPFRSTVAHGLLILSLVPSLRAVQNDPRYEGARLIVNSGFNGVRFIKPVKPGQSIRVRSVLKGIDLGKRHLEVRENIIVEVQDGARMIAQAEVVFRVYV